QRSWPNVKLVVAWRERGPPLLGGPFTFPVWGKRRCRSGLTALTRSACPAGIQSPRHSHRYAVLAFIVQWPSPAALARLHFKNRPMTEGWEDEPPRLWHLADMTTTLGDVRSSEANYLVVKLSLTRKW